jgi:hypothetical protein
MVEKLTDSRTWKTAIIDLVKPGWDSINKRLSLSKVSIGTTIHGIL